VRKNYQRKQHKSNHKFEIVRGQELLVPLTLVLFDQGTPVPIRPFLKEHMAETARVPRKTGSPQGYG
jgi:hypothetical protein